MDEYQKQNKKPSKKSNLLQNMEKIEQKRIERREKMHQTKQHRIEREQLNRDKNRNVDVDYEGMIDAERLDYKLQHLPISGNRLSVVVRKRPIFKKEAEEGEIDSISCSNPIIRVHVPKLRVDGITKYVENHDFQFDNAFSETDTTESVYRYSLQPILANIFDYGVLTCFAYGQTGSGKTFTMKGLQSHYVQDIYKLLAQKPSFSITINFFEIYGGKCFDLLNERNLLQILEDKNNNVQIQGLVERQARDKLEMIQIIDEAAVIRTTHATESNEESSRSHAICSVVVRDAKGFGRGKLILVDLAGSERAQDCQSNSKQRRVEGAEINKSLLALKECIRSMDSGAPHVPFRGSKLTLVLRDSFLSKSPNSHIVMFACISPGSTSADHTVNTLRYADRLKESSGVRPEVIKIIEQNSQSGRSKTEKTMISNKKKADNMSQQKISPSRMLREEKVYDHTQYLIGSHNQQSNGSIQADNSFSHASNPNPHLVGNTPKNGKNKENLQLSDKYASNKELFVGKITQLSSQTPSPSSGKGTSPPISQQLSNTLNQNPIFQQRLSKHQDHLQQQSHNTSLGISRERPITQQQEKVQKRQISIGKVKLIEKKTDQVSSQLSQSQNVQQILQQQQEQLQYQYKLMQQQKHMQKEQSYNSQGAQQKKDIKMNDSFGISKEKGNSANSQFSRKNQQTSQPPKQSHPLTNQMPLVQQKQLQLEGALNDHVSTKNKEVSLISEKAYQNSTEQRNKEQCIQQLKEKHEEIFSAHMCAIKEDANLLSLESGLLTDCRDGFMDCDIDHYVKRFETIVSKKLLMYNLLQQKMNKLKKMRTEFSEKYEQPPLEALNNQRSLSSQTGLQDDQSQGKKRLSFITKKKIDKF